jgi:hypothetical protein
MASKMGKPGWWQGTRVTLVLKEEEDSPNEKKPAHTKKRHKKFKKSSSPPPQTQDKEGDVAFPLAPSNYSTQKKSSPF